MSLLKMCNITMHGCSDKVEYYYLVVVKPQCIQERTIVSGYLRCWIRGQQIINCFRSIIIITIIRKDRA